MTTFHTGWWGVSRREDGAIEAWHFIEHNRVTMIALVLPNGDQVLYFRPTEKEPYLVREWLPSYEEMGNAHPGDGWDNDKYGAKASASMQVPKNFPRATRKPSAQELSGRAGKADDCKADGLSCAREIHVGIFFDGTNNNMTRDRESKGHSNIVSLFDAHKDDQAEYFKFYIEGVGTPFPAIDEKGEDEKGKSMARGGEARIHYAMIMLYNAVSRAGAKDDLVQPEEAKVLVNEIWKGLKTYYRGGNGKMMQIFRDLDQRLVSKLVCRRPQIMRVNLSVFGFSRGAAQARTFANWVKLATRGKVGPAELNFRFLGLYDTVASVLLADSSPVGSGLLDWANGSMRIPGDIEQTVHYCAGHEIRRSFPLSTLRFGGSWPAPAKEFVYPGAHSDVGGGYSPGDQGKGRGGRTDMLAQIPLNDMYFEGVNGGVRLSPLADLMSTVKRDFDVSPQLQSAFSAYLEWTPANEKSENMVGSRRGHVEERMQNQMQHYWRWRGKYTSDSELEKLNSWKNSKKQDQIDLTEGNRDWQVDLRRARAGHAPEEAPLVAGVKGAVAPAYQLSQLILPANPSQTQKDVVKAVDDRRAIPADVDRFFDDYVHDSHAGFWMLGPITRVDKAIFVNEIRRKKAANEYHLKQASEYHRLGEHDIAVSSYREARRYELNRFEQQVLALNPKDIDLDDPASEAKVPLMRDSDAADLRENMGFPGWVVKNVVGSGTRREANGVGQYRYVLDRDHERFFDPGREALYQMDQAVDAVKEKAKDVADKVGKAAGDAKQSVQRAAGDVVEGVINKGKDAAAEAVNGMRRKINPYPMPR